MISGIHEMVALIETGWKEKHILVVGDIMVDKYIRGTVDRVSPEAPVPVVHVLHHSEQPGGAANVAMNITGLGARATLAGFVGEDPDAQSLARNIEKAGIGDCLIRTQGAPTTSKLRILSGSQQLVRLDIEDTAPRQKQDYDSLIEQIATLLPQADAVILSDYAKGVLTEQICQYVISSARAVGIPVLVDPKSRDLSRYKNATTICPNLKELVVATGGNPSDIEMLLQQGQKLVPQLGLEFLTVTLSEKGIALLFNDKRSHAPAVAKQVFDVSGAGDTVIATLALAISSGVSAEEAAKVANIAAGIVVGKVGTVPISKYELVAALTSSSATQVEEKILDLSRLAVRVEAWRAAGETIVFTNGCFDILHVGHITLLEGCRKFGSKLIVAINSDSSVKGLKGSTRPIVGERERARILSALSATDAIIVFDQETPLELIKALRPNVLVKGGDYTEATVVGAADMKSWGGRVEIVPTVAGFSTSGVVHKLKAQSYTEQPV
jgi:D-beta-D-heptose 7-phosphate kinase / D-beta-D-heptose 1-phosphate adenosyltransferase